MPFTFVQSNVGAAAADVSVSTTLTGVTAGNLIIVFTGYQDPTTTMVISDGTSTLLKGTTNDTGPHTVFAYLLAANGGTRTYTMTPGTGLHFMRIHAWEFAYTGGAISLDSERNDASGTTAAVSSNPFSTTGTDTLAMAGLYAAGDVSLIATPQIDSNNATDTLNPASTGMATWYRAVTAPISGGLATGTVAGGGGSAWVVGTIAFTVAAAGPQTVIGGAPVVRRSRNRVF